MLIISICDKVLMGKLTESVMGGVFYKNLTSTVSEIHKCLQLGTNNFSIVGIPDEKNISEAKNPEDIASQIIKKIKNHYIYRIARQSAHH